MLASWIYDGQLADPYGEFMVREEDTLDKENVREDFNAQYWESRYTVEKEMVCSFLWELANKILTTGKCVVPTSILISCNASCFSLAMYATPNYIYLPPSIISYSSQGKYLNVVRECGKALSCPHKAPICMDDTGLEIVIFFLIWNLAKRLLIHISACMYYALMLMCLNLYCRCLFGMHQPIYWYRIKGLWIFEPDAVRLSVARERSAS